MLDALKNFIHDLVGEAPPEPAALASDHQIAAAALMIHLACVDGVFDAQEQERIQHIVETRFGLDRDAARVLIDEAWESEREAVDLFRFTSILKRRLDEQEREHLVSLLWDMAYADGDLHEFEENVVWRVSELLGVPARVRVRLRSDARAAEASGEDKSENPWSKPTSQS